MRRQVTIWQWLIIAIGLIIIVVWAGMAIYHRVTASRQPPPPASPEEAAREYQEEVLGYPAQPKTRK